MTGSTLPRHSGEGRSTLLTAAAKRQTVAGMTDPATLHRALLTIDTHIDIPWPDGPSPFEDGPRRVDLPKMLRGGLAAGCFAAYIPQGARDDAAHEAAFARAIAMLGAIRAMGHPQPNGGGPASGLTGRIATSVAEIESARADGVPAIIPAVENGYAIGTEVDRLTRLRALGARYLTLTHNGHNALADAAIPRPDLGDKAEAHGGLSPLGRAAIGRMNALGMLVDVSHAARSTMVQAAEASRTPVLATHSAIRALCDHPRNLDDGQLDVLRATGGLIQITAVPAFLKADAKAGEVGLAEFAAHIDYAVQRIGIAHVGIGSDFDGGGGFTGWHDAAESPNVTAELLRRGYDRPAIAALWGGNFLRLLRLAEHAAT